MHTVYIVFFSGQIIPSTFKSIFTDAHGMHRLLFLGRSFQVSLKALSLTHTVYIVSLFFWQIIPSSWREGTPPPSSLPGDDWLICACTHTLPLLPLQQLLQPRHHRHHRRRRHQHLFLPRHHHEEQIRLRRWARMALKGNCHVSMV